MKRSFVLDLARVIAITFVFVAHFGQLLDSDIGGFFGVKNIYYVSLGGVGVSVFLVLSGILAGLSDARKQSPFFTYMARKIQRIYPIYLLSIPLAILGYLLAQLLLEGRIPSLFPNGLFIDFFGSVTGFYSWLGLWGGPYNPPSWFIGLIISMYALALPMIAAFKRWPHITPCFLLAISLISRWFVGQEGVLPFTDSLYDEIKGWAYRQFGFMPGRPADWFPLCRVFEFGLGIYLATVINREFWFRIDIPWLKQPVAFLSDIAFPLFLLHYPFMFMVILLIKASVPIWLAMTLFMFLIIAMSWSVDWYAKRLPTLKLMRKLSRARE
ncbi:acyltransferase family protein [Veronia pacifica]|uniref:Acyltransferase n=1 Tax=Veronia pacifica TaxID=1080227 RepID=A0A1C3ELE5_9GAMM|nr:acyltransferase family protein [Veronia pacifica]ODA34063.1 acyltransferase [Veronia pacifica]